MFSVLVWGCDWIILMYGWFCAIRLIHLIRWKYFHFKKKLIMCINTKCKLYPLFTRCAVSVNMVGARHDSSTLFSYWSIIQDFWNWLEAGNYLSRHHNIIDIDGSRLWTTTDTLLLKIVHRSVPTCAAAPLKSLFKVKIPR